jgi:hypothetical protein
MIRFRPRFSLRTLAIVVTGFCLYLGTWPLTRKYGLPDITFNTSTPMSVNVWVVSADSPLPLIVRQEVIVNPRSAQVFKREYLLWLAVVKIKLPYESSVW